MKLLIPDPMVNVTGIQFDLDPEVKIVQGPEPERTYHKSLIRSRIRRKKAVNACGFISVRIRIV